MGRKTRFSWLAAAVLSAAALHAGTLFYRNAEGQLEVAGHITVAGIAGGRIEFSDAEGNFVLNAAEVVRYYQEEIKVADGPVDDHTTAYAIRVDTIELAEGNKKRQPVFQFRYQLMRDQQPGNDPRIREPYFYLVVLSDATDGKNDRKRSVFAVPGAVKLGGRGWSEARILEKLLDPKRPLRDPDQPSGGGAPGPLLAGEKITIPLTGLNRRKIVAYHLTAWGKNQLEDSKLWIDASAEVEPDWLTCEYR